MLAVHTEGARSSSRSLQRRVITGRQHNVTVHGDDPVAATDQKVVWGHRRPEGVQRGAEQSLRSRSPSCVDRAVSSDMCSIPFTRQLFPKSC